MTEKEFNIALAEAMGLVSIETLGNMVFGYKQGAEVYLPYTVPLRINYKDPCIRCACEDWLVASARWYPCHDLLMGVFYWVDRAKLKIGREVEDADPFKATALAYIKAKLGAGKNE